MHEAGTVNTKLEVVTLPVCEHGVAGDDGVEPGLALVEAEAVLKGSHTLRGFDRFPAEVELTNPRHPLAGQREPVMSAYRRNGGVWLM